MSVAWMLARSDFARRWRSWIVLGLLAGASVGLALAGVAGVRRTERAIPDYVRRAHVPDAAILPNDPAFDANARADVARLPEVRSTAPFFIGIGLRVAAPEGMEMSLVPLGPRSYPALTGVLVDGRLPNPRRADEMLVNESARDRFDLDIGSYVTLVQPDPKDLSGIPPEFLRPGLGPIRQRVRVVGISDSADDRSDSMLSSGFYAKHRTKLLGFSNEFVTLRHGERDLARLQADVARIAGHPVNVESASELFGIAKLTDVSNVERNGLLLFALAVVLGAGALVGQALVRAVSAGGADLPTWRAIGVDQVTGAAALVLPVVATSVVAMVTAVTVAVLLSPQFPIALTRRYDLGLGFHADWLVLVPGALALGVGLLGAAWIAAAVTLRRRANRRAALPVAARVAVAANLAPALLIGSRLAVEPGRGHRAVPVRSALVGAIAGVLGVVACLTFRAGIADAVADPARSGIVWDHFVAAEGEVPPAIQAAIRKDPEVDAVLNARWARAVQINDVPTPTFGIRTVSGDIAPVVLAGRAPDGDDEIAMAPTTMDKLGVGIGDEVRVGSVPGRTMRVVGRALLPSTSHTDYDLSAWIPLDQLSSVVADAQQSSFEDYLLVRFGADADVPAVRQRLTAISEAEGYFEGPAELPTAIQSLGQLRALPFALAAFFGLLAIATVAHALVTTVRRRRYDLAILRSIGFTRRNVRLAIAWQSTLLALAGLIVGVPAGIAVGRVSWRQLAHTFPVAYVAPIALVAILLVVPIAVLIANLVAAGPAHAATRSRPAAVLRTE